MTVVVPSVPTPAPSRSDPANFAERADAFHAVFPAVVESMNLQNAENNSLNTQASASAVLSQSHATSASTQAGNAATSALAAANSAANAAATQGGQLWVSGTSYAAGYLVYSPLNGRSYRRVAAGSGTVDPSLDTSNWLLLSVVMEQGDTGNLPNQIPFNLSLGSMAFQNAESLVLKPASSSTPHTVGSLVFQLTNDTTLVIKAKGADGTVRSVTLTLA